MVPEKPIILFDGVCNLCNSAVTFVIKRDPQQKFVFASLQSTTGQALLKKFNLSDHNLSSFVFIENGRVYQKSTAALMVSKQLSGVAQLLYGFIIVPAFIRNAVYNFIAKNRYKWFGKKDSCMIPTIQLQSRFLK